MTNDELPMTNQCRMTKLGSTGASPATASPARTFGDPAEKLPMVSREARDTAGGAPALPVISASEFSEIFLQHSSRGCGTTAWQVTSHLRCATARQALGITRMATPSTFWIDKYVLRVRSAKYRWQKLVLRLQQRPEAAFRGASKDA